MIVNTTIIIPTVDAYVLAARRVPTDWHTITPHKLKMLANDNPEWSWFSASVIRSSRWGKRLNLIHECTHERWAADADRAEA